MGPWQVAPLITRKYGFTINSIIAPESNPVIRDLLLDLARDAGLEDRRGQHAGSHWAVEQQMLAAARALLTGEKSDA